MGYFLGPLGNCFQESWAIFWTPFGPQLVFKLSLLVFKLWPARNISLDVEKMSWNGREPGMSLGLGIAVAEPAGVPVLHKSQICFTCQASCVMDVCLYSLENTYAPTSGG